MCVAAIAWHSHPHWPLVVIGNRDEYHARPAAALARWPNGLIAGQDLQSGGTWLGASDQGRFVLVTNLRGHGDPDPGKVSRGGLVVDLLKGGSPDAADLAAYNPFNLLLAAGGGLHFLTNRPDPAITALPHGIYGVSNGALDEPWAKTLALKSALGDWLSAGTHDPAPLFAALAIDTLPRIGLHPHQPSDIAAEPSETPPFIRNPVYGTRCSTVVVIGRTGHGRIIERRFDTAGALTDETMEPLRWPG